MKKTLVKEKEYNILCDGDSLIKNFVKKNSMEKNLTKEKRVQSPPLVDII